MAVVPDAPPQADPGEAAVRADTSTDEALVQQLAALEARIAEQDKAIRRVLDLLIDWAERDPETAPAVRRDWAA